MSDTSPESASAQSESKPNAPIEIDLYCLECGYNLRGLSGDPVRCPECAFLNPIGDVEIPAPIISKQLRRMETAPAASVLGFLFLLPLLGLWAAIIDDGVWLDADAIVCVGVPTFGSLLTWIVGAYRFRSSCLGRPGWLATLLRYQLIALLLVAVIGIVFGCAACVVKLSSGPVAAYDRLAAYALGGLAAFLLVLAVILRGLRPVHRWLKAPMEQLQRQVAVRLARDRIRQELRHARR
jgi:hypothetical protein